MIHNKSLCHGKIISNFQKVMKGESTIISLICKVAIFYLFAFTMIHFARADAINLLFDTFESGNIYANNTLYVNGNGFQFSVTNSIFDNFTLYIVGASVATIQQNTLVYSMVRVNETQQVVVKNNVEARYEAAQFFRPLKPCALDIAMDVAGWSNVEITNNKQIFNTSRVGRFICFRALTPPASGANRTLIDDNLVSITQSPTPLLYGPYLGSYVNAADPYADGIDVLALLSLWNVRDPELLFSNDTVYEDWYNQTVANYYPPGLMPYDVSKSHILISFGNQILPNGASIQNNRYEHTMNRTSSYDGFSDFYFRMDNFIRVHAFGGVSSLNRAGNTMNVFNHNNGLRAPIRAAIVFTGGTLSSLQTLFPLINVPLSLKSYQYVPRLLRDNYFSSLSGVAFQSDVEIEPAPSVDEYNGYNGGDLCHYRCRGDCTYCKLSYTAGLGIREFSPQTDGACYGVTRSENLFDASRHCGHETLCITGPVTTGFAGIFTSRNLFTYKLKVQPCDLSKQVRIGMNPTLETTAEYRSVVNPDLPNDPTYFANYHPHVIATRYNASDDSSNPYAFRMTRIDFENIYFEYNYTVLSQANVFFTLVQHHSTPYDRTIPSLSLENKDTLEMYFHQCVMNGRNIEQFPSNGQSAPLSFMETSASPVVYPDVRFFSNANITHLEFVNVTFRDLGKIIRNQAFVGTLNMVDVNSISLTNGWIWVNVSKDVYMRRVSCIDCQVDITGLSMRVEGSFGDTNSILRDLYFNTTRFYDTIGLTRAYQIVGFNQIVFENLISNTGAIATGIYFENLLDLPCNKLSLALAKNSNPSIHGIFNDVLCYPPLLGCKDAVCYNDVDFTPAFCIIDPTIDIFTRFYSIIYFHTWQDATTNCKARDANGIRVIHFNPQYVFPEDAIVFTNYNNTVFEHTIFRCNTTIAPYGVIKGSNHIIQRQNPSAPVAFTFENVLFLDPLNVEVYTGSAPHSSLLYVALGVDIENVTLINVQFVANVPLIATGPIPTDVTTPAWNSFINSLLSISTIHPSIRTPNVITPLILRTTGKTIMKNVRFYGALNRGFVDTKVQGDSTQTYLYNVTGYNLWGGACDVDAPRNLTVRMVRFEYFVGAYSSSFPNPISVRLIVDGTGPNAVFDVDDLVVRSIQNPNGLNTYTPNARLVIGNPFLDPITSNPVGYVRHLSIHGIEGSNFAKVYMKMVVGEISPVFKVALEEGDNDRVAMALNDAIIPLVFDTRTLMREIWRSNQARGGFISGAVYDIRHGTYAGDTGATLSLYCNDGCLPTSSAIYCRVSAFITPIYPASPVDFNDINLALEKCPYNVFRLLDSNYTININYTLPNSRSPVPNSVLTLISTALGGTRIFGKHVFYSECSSPGLLAPTDLLLSGITFEYAPTANDERILSFQRANILSTCDLASIRIENGGFRILSGVPSTITGTVGVECKACRADIFSMDSIVWDLQSLDGNFIGVRYEPETAMGAALNDFRMNRQSMTTTSLPILKIAQLIRPTNFDIGGASFSIRCRYNTPSCIQITGSSTVNLLSGQHAVHDLILVGVTGTETILGSGVVWESDQNGLTLQTIATQYTNQFRRLSISGFPNHGGFTTPDLITPINYPCVNNSCIYIATLLLQNPGTSNTGLKQDWFWDTSSFQVLNDAATNTTTAAQIYYCFLSRYGCSVLNISNALGYVPHQLLLFGFILLGIVLIVVIFNLCCGGCNYATGAYDEIFSKPRYARVSTKEDNDRTFKEE